jgi:serine/threonine protein kinase
MSPAPSVPLPPQNLANDGARALPHLGDTIGRYQLHRVIGEGGMGTVYEAEHLVLEKRVALKVLRPEIAAHAELRQRFVREGLATSRVRHPHVVDVTDAAEENGQAYLVMELLSGHGLDAELAQHGRMDVSRASEIILPICAALAEAHAVGIVHRDMKPENVLLVRAFGDRIVPKVVDFGISDVIGAAWTDGSCGVLGTPQYMAPEQATGASVDGLADQYSVGVMLFELLTGRLPYANGVLGDPAALLSDVAAGRAHRLSQVWRGAPERLDAVIGRAMHVDPRQRFRTMERFGRALLPLASPRAVRRYRDLVEPGWSAVLPAAGAPPLSGGRYQAPRGSLAERDANGSGRSGLGRERADRVPRILRSPPQRREELPKPPTVKVIVRPAMDTIATAPPDMSEHAAPAAPAAVEDASRAERSRLPSSVRTLRCPSVPPPEPPPTPETASTPTPSESSRPTRTRRVCQRIVIPVVTLPPESPSVRRRDLRVPAAIVGALLALVSILVLAIASSPGLRRPRVMTTGEQVHLREP